ncbi:rolling circle replication-associated protein [Spiroplasma endosymbiont of Dilophus febrilis]|uniref:rolling circle replication-associated protein n=2 Tax=Spiroplasma endosymbiont of Dilophus febrilis TaxID=3066292 RepID=UPI00313AC4B1
MNLQAQNPTDFYMKTIYYGQYIRNVVMPLERIKANTRNVSGLKNKGERKTKMLNSNVRAKCSAVRKAYHNFSVKELTFLTLTYKLKETDVKKCKKELKKFFRNIKYYFKKKNKEIKYFYTYEYQQRGAIHFHILLDKKIPNKLVLKHWPYGLNKNLVVKQDTNEAVVKYCSKYITKNVLNEKSLNQYDLNIKAYQFSYNCQNPITRKQVFTDTLNNIVNRTINSEFVKYLKSAVNKFKTKMCGVIYEFKNINYVDFESANYASLESLRFRNQLRKMKY